MKDTLQKAVVDPGDLYTILRLFYASNKDEPYSQAEQACADRLNKVLCALDWEVKLEHLRQSDE